MLGHPNRGEDIEFYADRFEERQEALREYYDDEQDDVENNGGGFPEEDARESRKTIAQQSEIHNQ
jgi:hypothetical protein